MALRVADVRCTASMSDGRLRRTRCGEERESTPVAAPAPAAACFPRGKGVGAWEEEHEESRMPVERCTLSSSAAAIWSERDESNFLSASFSSSSPVPLPLPPLPSTCCRQMCCKCCRCCNDVISPRSVCDQISIPPTPEACAAVALIVAPDVAKAVAPPPISSEPSPLWPGSAPPAQ